MNFHQAGITPGNIYAEFQVPPVNFPAFPHKIPIKKSLDGVVENAMNFIPFLLAYRKAELRQFLGQYRRAWRHKRAGVSIGQFKILGLCAQKFLPDAQLFSSLSLKDPCQWQLQALEWRILPKDPGPKSMP